VFTVIVLSSLKDYSDYLFSFT